MFLPKYIKCLLSYLVFLTLLDQRKNMFYTQNPPELLGKLFAQENPEAIKLSD